MFTGLVEEVGTVERIQRGRQSAVLHLRAQAVLAGMKLGDSIAVNGVCLTVISFHTGGFAADVMHETLDRSALAKLRSGSRVNLERAMAADGRFGGHIVAGHVDGTGRTTRLQKDDNAIWYTIQPPPGLLRYVVEKGSIAVDGVSLTVAQVDSIKKAHGHRSIDSLGQFFQGMIDFNGSHALSTNNFSTFSTPPMTRAVPRKFPSWSCTRYRPSWAL